MPCGSLAAKGVSIPAVSIELRAARGQVSIVTWALEMRIGALRICPMLGSLRSAFSLLRFLRFGAHSESKRGFWRGDEWCAGLRKDGDFVLKHFRAGDRDESRAWRALAASGTARRWPGSVGFVAMISFRLNCGTRMGWFWRR